MKKINDIWDALGSLNDDDIPHVLNKLFIVYETILEQDEKNEDALLFMQRLDNAITQTVECNLNRR
jgi:hypothetical protein